MLKTRLEKICGKTIADSSYEELYRAFTEVVKEESKEREQRAEGTKL